MKLIFIRHGEANYQTDKLTLRGKIQIQWAKKYISNETPTAIYCSPRTRTLQTANIINKKYKAPLHIMQEINERQYLNDKERALYWDDYDKHYLDYTYENKHFETCKDFIDRCISGFEKIVKETGRNDTVIVCAHSSTLYALNAYINGIPETQKIDWVQCSNGAIIKYHL